MCSVPSRSSGNKFSQPNNTLVNVVFVFRFFPFTCLAVSIYGLASKKQTAKIILIGLHVLVKILVKKKRKSGVGRG